MAKQITNPEPERTLVTYHDMQRTRTMQVATALLRELWPNLICLMDTSMVEHRCHVDYHDAARFQYMPVFCECGYVFMAHRHGELTTTCDKCYRTLWTLKDYTAEQLLDYPRKIQQVEVREQLHLRATQRLCMAKAKAKATRQDHQTADR